MKVHIVTAEHQTYGAGGEPYVILGVFEDAADAQSFCDDLKAGRAGEDYSWLGSWGPHGDGPQDDGWSDNEWWVNLETHDVASGKGSSRAAKDYVKVKVPAKDLELINKHRRGIGMGPIDLDAGWTNRELKQMADSIRQQGRLPNPKYSRDELSNRSGAAGRALLGSWLGHILGNLVAPGAGTLAGAAGGYFGPKLYWRPPGSDAKGVTGQIQERRIGSASTGGAIGSLIFGPLGAAAGAALGAGGPPSAQNPYAYDEYRHLTDDDREKLLSFIMSAQEAKVQAELARSRGDHTRARQYDRKYQAAAEKLFQLEERLAVSHKAPARRKRRRNGGG